MPILKDEISALKLASGCVDCGYRDNAEALHFDHLPGERKLADISDLVYKGSRTKVLREIKKCEIVCAICHTLRTVKRRNASPAKVRPDFGRYRWLTLKERAVNAELDIVLALWPEMCYVSVH